MGKGGLLRWGILGTGRIASDFVEALRHIPDASVSTVAARSRADSEAFARHRGIGKACAPYGEALRREDVDIVYVGTPNSTHVELATAALRAGKHVLCEKPLAPDAGTAAELFALAADAGLVLSEGFMYRYHPQTQRLIDLACSGELGYVNLVRACYSFPISSEDDIRLNSSLQGGSLWDIGGYAVDLSRRILGPPSQVYASAAVEPSGVDTSAFGIVVHVGGGRSVFDCSFRLPPRGWAEVVGTLGSITVADAFKPGEGILEVTTGDGTRSVETVAANAYMEEAQGVMDAVNGNPHAALGRHDAVWNAATVAALHESVVTCGPVTVQA